MNAKSRRLISTLLTLSLVLSLVYALPITASAATNSTATTINLEDDWFGNSNFGFAGSWMYYADLNIIYVYDDLEVIGTVNNANETLIFLYDAENKNVTWRASYSVIGSICAVEATTGYNISTGNYDYSGSFTAVAGSLISGHGCLWAERPIGVYITGGTITAPDSTAVTCWTLTMSGGVVTGSGAENDAVFCSNMTVTGSPIINGNIVIYKNGNTNAKIIVDAGGNLTVNGKVKLYEPDSGIIVNGQDSSAKITDDVFFTRSISGTTAIFANDGAEITIEGAITFNGKIQNSGTGIGASGNSRIAIKGGIRFVDEIYANSIGISSTGGSNISINGNVVYMGDIRGRDGTLWTYGIYASDAKITINADITFEGKIQYMCRGIFVSDAEICVAGNVRFGDNIPGNDDFGILATSSAAYTHVIIGGNVVADNMGGCFIYAQNSNTIVDIGGYVTGVFYMVAYPGLIASGCMIIVQGATVNVAGDATVIDTDISKPICVVWSLNCGKANIGGDVVSGYSFGVNATGGSEVTIDGEIRAPRYVQVGNRFKQKEDDELTSTKNGYREYRGTDNDYQDVTLTSYVWVKDAAIHTITFNTNGIGASVTPTSGHTGLSGTLSYLPTPTRSGYRFIGWFTSPTGGEPVATTREYTDDTTIYAQWSPISSTATTINLEDDWFGSSDFGFAGSWMYDAERNIVSVYDDVEVIGTVNNASKTLLFLYEAESKNVTWKASYSVVGPDYAVGATTWFVEYTSSYLYSGSFTAVAGSSISGYGEGACGLGAESSIHVYITGGTITATGISYSYAVNCFTLTMSDGVVTATGAENCAICCSLMTVTGDIIINGNVKIGYGRVDNKILVGAGGNLSVNGNVSLYEANSSINVSGMDSSAKITGDVYFSKNISGATAIFANDGADITIDGAVSFNGKIHNAGTGIGASGNSRIAIKGDIRFVDGIYGQGIGISSTGDSNISIDGNITYMKDFLAWDGTLWTYAYGIYASNAKITIIGDIGFEGKILSLSCGIFVSDAEISITGNVSFKDNIPSYESGGFGILATSDAATTHVTINGDVNSTGGGDIIYALYDNTLVDIFGDVVGRGGWRLMVHGAILNISGDVITSDKPDNYCASVESTNGKINIGGDVVSNSYYGVESRGSGEITIEGEIRAPEYVWVGYMGKRKEDNEPTSSKEGYLEYKAASNDGPGTSYVWVKDTAHTVSFDANGGTVSPQNAKTKADGTLSVPLPVPMRSSHTFRGWFTSRVGGVRVNQGDIYGADATIYAQWDATTYQPPSTPPSSPPSTPPSSPPSGTIDNMTQITVPSARWTPKLESDLHIRYIFGYPDGSFKPEKAITRAEAVTIFYRLITADDKEAKITSSFTDVKQGDWFYQAVAYLEKYGLIVDSPNGLFRPNDPITRAEYAALASGFDKLDADAPSAFPDVPGDHWAARYINSAAAKGWVKGFDDGKFRPESTLTRAQLVTIVSRMLKRKIELSDTTANAPKYTDLATSHWAYSTIIDAST